METDSSAPLAKKARNKPKVVKDWEESETHKLITYVEGEPCLWDAGNADYHNKICRDGAWRSIAMEAFDGKFAQGDLIAKWTNLRIQYRRYAAGAKTKSGQGAVPLPKWKYFHAMGFVGRAEEHQTQTTISNLVSEVLENGNDDPDVALIPPEEPLRISRRPKPQDSASPATQVLGTMREAISAIKENRRNAFDPNESFANYLVSELRTLSDDVAASIRCSETSHFLQCLTDAANKKAL